MLKQISSLGLVLVVAGSLFAGNVWVGSEHICKMMRMPNMAHMSGIKMAGEAPRSDMETNSGPMSFGVGDMSEMNVPDSETMPGCKDHAEAATELSDNECCVTIPNHSGSTVAISNVRPSFSVAISCPVSTQAPVFPPRQGTRSFVVKLFLPNLQTTYIRNLSFLI